MKKLGLGPDRPPSDPEAWTAFLEHVDRFYREADQERYLMERSLSVSSREMQDLYDQLRETSHEREARYRALLDHLPVGVYRTTPDGRFIEANPATADLFGVADVEAVQALDARDLFLHAEERDRYVERLLREGTITLEFALRRVDGSVIWVRDFARAIRETPDGAVYFDGILVDITERNRAEEALRESEARSRALLAAIPDLMFRLRGDGTILDFKGEQGDLLMPADRIVGANLADVPKPPSLIQAWMQYVERVLATGEAQHHEYELALPKGRQVFEARIVQSGKDEVLCIIRNITERKQAEEALRESEQRFRDLFESSPDAIFVEDFDGNVLDANPAAGRLHRVDGARLVGENVRTLVPPGQREKAMDAFARMVAGDLDRWEGSSWTVDGDEVPVEIRVSRITHDHHPALLLQVRDVTARRRAEQRLRLLEASVSASLDGITISDALLPDYPLVYVSPGFERMTGYTADEALGRNCRFLQQDDRDQPALDEIRAALKSGVECRVLLRNYHKDGTLFWNELTIYPLYDPAGRLSHVVGIQRDITERKQVEQKLARINAELEQRNRELQDFAYVASHDLQEPLRKIRAFADLMQEDYDDKVDETGKYYLDRMQDAAARMAGLITDLLAYSRVTTREQPFGKVDLNAVVADVLSDLEMQIHETGGRITVSNLPTIDGDATQMRQLLQNFVANALKFHKPGVAPVVEIVGTLEERPARDGAYAETVCRLEVRDNGIGFDEKYLDRIFTPFQRLHGRDAYAGTGMGLAICRRIVERHRGVITAHSAPGQGTRFVVTFPLEQPPVSAESDPA